MHTGELFADRFLLDRAAGSGAMGTVWRAIDRESGQPVAVKAMLPRPGAMLSARFAREIAILAQLDHPHVVRYVAHGLEPTPFLVMEWLEGEDLASRLMGGALGVRDTVDVISGLADALGCVHQLGVVHRDVKPANVFLEAGEPSRAKLLDFGVARLVERSATATGALLGTPQYMAPEQARGEREVGARADVFALGAVAFECLTGQPAFPGTHGIAVLGRILLEEPPALRELVPDAPRALEDLLAAMLAKDPRARPADGAAVASRLLSLGGPPGTASLPPARPGLGHGERQLVAVVLVSSVTGLDDALADTAVPSEAPSALAELTRSFGGRLDQLVDGSTVISFARTDAATDLARRAARCALCLRDAAPTARMALAVGREELTLASPFGPVLDRVAAMLDATTTGIRVDQVAAGLLAEFRLEGDPAAPRLLGEGPTDGDRPLLGRPTPFVGRDRELRALLELYEESATEPVARAVVVTGPPGMGKSRLRRELVRRLSERRPAPRVWVARGEALGAGAPFGMIAGALRSALGLGEPMAAEQERARLLDRLAERGPAVDPLATAEFIGELLRLPFPDDGRPALQAARRDAQLMGDQMRRAVERLVEAELHARDGAEALVLVLEDLHWGDRPSVELVDALLQALADRPLFVLALARPELHESFPSLWNGRLVEQMSLRELPRRAAARLAREILPPPADERQVGLLVERASGNVLYLEELLRDAVERGASRSSSGSSSGAARPPDTVLAMVGARLERLPAGLRRVLRAASVLGGRFALGGLQALLGPDGGDCALELEALCGHEAIRRVTLAESRAATEYEFRHALVREAAYAMLTDPDRALGHRLAAEWLEQRGGCDALVLAEHFVRGNESLRAARWWGTAAEQALEGHDLDAAYERADRATQCGAAGEALGRARLVQAEACYFLDRLPQAQACAREALSSSAPGSPTWSDACRALADASFRLGDCDALGELGHTLMAGVEDWAVDGPLVRAVANAVSRLLKVGQGGLADALGSWCNEAGRTLGDGELGAVAALHEANAFRGKLRGDLFATLSGFEAALGACQRSGDLRRELTQRVNVGDSCLQLGAFARAAEIHRGQIADCRRLGLKALATIGLCNLGLAEARLGRLAEAEAAEREALGEASAGGNRYFEFCARAYLCDVLTMGGRLRDAESAARDAMAVAFSPPLRAFGAALLARVQLGLGRAPDADETLRTGTAELESPAAVDEGESLIRLVSAETLWALGRQTDARAVARAACERLHQRAALISSPDYRRSFLHDVPENARTLDLARDWLGEAP